jgi:hypothetical protein
MNGRPVAPEHESRLVDLRCFAMEDGEQEIVFSFGGPTPTHNPILPGPIAPQIVLRERTVK